MDIEAIAILLLEPDSWRRLGFVHVVQNKSGLTLLEERDHHRVLALTGAPAELRPNVVMISDTLLREFSLSVITKIKKLFPQANILVHGYEGNADRVAEIFIAGATGYFSLSDKPENLVESLKLVSKGLIWGPPEAIARSLGRLISLKDTKPTVTRADLITPRERTLLNFLGKGFTNKEIANSLGIAEVTVKFHLAKLYNKFNVQSRLQLLMFAIERGLISGPNNSQRPTIDLSKAFKRPGRQLGRNSKRLLVRARRPTIL